jgi:hypothetical protein
MPDQNYINKALREVKGDLGIGQLKHPVKGEPVVLVDMGKFPTRLWARKLKIQHKLHRRNAPVSTVTLKK